ncbi:Senescence-inducible chloroplast stay-green protein 1 [Zostera marina]|uniref:Senescence-inducible chloroplast stay-green protein 1 n=1 Tax=Zostera marina TaxID=29655 RepID=A0A0K9NNC9_ZOSMR|nr:Senescence-inducible chloroplast stay-green protein 1 [Zostera marina]
MASSHLFPCNLSCLNGTASSSSVLSLNLRDAVSAKTVVVQSSSIRNGSLVFKIARLLSPQIQFQPSKLDVLFHGQDLVKQSPCTFPRTYTLTHCDFTANLTLAVSNSINIHQLRTWQTKLQKDDVVAEWKKVKDDISLHVHCYVGGSNLLQDLAAEFRYYIFSKELPLVLQAVIYGDSILFDEHPDLLDASVWVYFHSISRKYNRLECWGPLKDATQRTLDDVWDVASEQKMEEPSMKCSRSRHKTILHALVSFLL